MVSRTLDCPKEKESVKGVVRGPKERILRWVQRGERDETSQPLVWATSVAWEHIDVSSQRALYLTGSEKPRRV